MRELALSGRTLTDLAKQYGVTQSAVSQFQTRHELQILEMRADSENELAGILYVKKGERLQKYAEMLEEGTMSASDVQRALRQMAEELGSLPNRVTMGGEINTKVTYEVAGVDPEALT